MFSLLALCLASDQPITVVNKCPPPIIVVVKTVAPEVAPAKAKPFRGEQFHAGHQCPSCGRSQYVIAGWVGNGQHRHTCSYCRTSWIH